MNFVLVQFGEFGPTIYGPFDSEFAATHYHDTHFKQADSVLLMPLIPPQGATSGNEKGSVENDGQEALPL